MAFKIPCDIHLLIEIEISGSDKKKSLHVVLIVSSVSGVLLLGTIVFSLRMMAKKKGNNSVIVILI